MTITITPNAGATTIRLEGELNAVTSPSVKATLNELAGQGTSRIVVDLQGVPFIDSSGLGALVSGLKAAKLAGGSLALAGLQDQARAIFEITMAYRLFDVYATAAEACASAPEA